MASTILQLRRDISTNWAANNPELAQGEPGLEIDTGKWKLGDGATLWNSLSYQNSQGNLRTSISLTSAFLANTASDTTNTLAIGKNGEIYSIATSVPAAIRLYSTAAARSADLSRSIGAPIPLDAGVLGECITNGSNLSFSRILQYVNMDSSPNSYVYVTFINLSGTSQTITTTIEYFKLEN